MKQFNHHHVVTMRAMRRAGIKVVSVKKYFRYEGFTDDDTVDLFNTQLNEPDLGKVLLAVNSRIRDRANP